MMTFCMWEEEPWSDFISLFSMLGGHFDPAGVWMLRCTCPLRFSNEGHCV